MRFINILIPRAHKFLNTHLNNPDKMYTYIYRGRKITL